jgi:hypothetical protein
LFPFVTCQILIGDFGKINVLILYRRKKYFVCRFLPNDAARGAPPPAWFNILLQRILDHNQAVLSLLGTLPEQFRNKPPKHLRAWLYDYRFTYKREQDSKKLVEDTPPDQIGKTWYRNRVGIYAKASKKDE